MNKCSICGRGYLGMGHNAQPVNDGRCCGTCNALKVIPARMASLFAKPEPKPAEEPCILVTGNPAEGFKFFGPFDGFLTAKEFAEGVDGGGWVARLESPDK